MSHEYGSVGDGNNQPYTSGLAAVLLCQPHPAPVSIPAVVWTMTFSAAFKCLDSSPAAPRPWNRPYPRMADCRGRGCVGGGGSRAAKGGRGVHMKGGMLQHLHAVTVD
jgi:hypothetical protein